MRQLLRDPSIPVWVNALTVIVLAAITWWYARNANRQADAAESQAKAAIKQAEVGERQLAILQAQVQEQAGIAAARLKENIAELHQAATHWLERMRAWGQLTEQKTELDLLPTDWSASIEHARKVSPEMYRELLTLQRASRNVGLLMGQFSSRAPSYRRENEVAEINKQLSWIIERCEAMAKNLGTI